jgi:hypothetical protein
MFIDKPRAQLLTLMILTATAACEVSRSHQQLVPVTVGASLDEKKSVAASTVNDAGVADLKRRIKAECPSIPDAQMNRLALQVVNSTTHSPNGTSTEDVHVRVIVEIVSSESELLFEAAVAHVKRVVSPPDDAADRRR